jgi:hypothetical protein
MSACGGCGYLLGLRARRGIAGSGSAGAASTGSMPTLDDLIEVLASDVRYSVRTAASSTHKT